MSLIETLKAAKDRAIAESDPSGRRAILEEWGNAISRFNKSVLSWVEEYKAADLLRVSHTLAKVKEEPLGSYEVKMIQLGAGKQEVVFQPAGRFITDATGRIDMYVKGRGAIDERYRILRKNEGDQDYWIILAPGEQKNMIMEISGANRWNKRTFEAALEKLIK